MLFTIERVAILVEFLGGCLLAIDAFGAVRAKKLDNALRRARERMWPVKMDLTSIVKALRPRIARIVVTAPILLLLGLSLWMSLTSLPSGSQAPSWQDRGMMTADPTPIRIGSSDPMLPQPVATVLGWAILLSPFGILLALVGSLWAVLIAGVSALLAATFFVSRRPEMVSPEQAPRQQLWLLGIFSLWIPGIAAIAGLAFLALIIAATLLVSLTMLGVYALSGPFLASSWASDRWQFESGLKFAGFALFTIGALLHFVSTFP